MTTRAKAEARKARAIEREKGFKTNPAEIPNMADALFGSGRDGSVEMYAGPKGQELIQGLFPNLIFKWASHDWQGKWPADWQAVEIHLPSAVTKMNSKPSFFDAIPEGRSIEDITRDQLCLLLALGVKRAGGRAAVLRQDGKCDLYVPRLA